MKQAMINYIKSPTFDNLYTPAYAVTPLLEYVSKTAVIWECCDAGGSEYTKVFRENGNHVIASDIQTGENFFDYEPEEHYDIIITNPPYSLKNEFLERAYSLNKPFAFLLPITTLESQARNKIFRNYNSELELLVFDKRVEFLKNGKNNNWFNTSYFCRNFLPDKIIFYELSKIRGD